MDGLSNMMADDGLERAASLLAQAPLHAITFGGTSASFLEGIGYDQRVCERIAALAPGIPSSTTSTAALRALRALGAKSVSFVGPYLEDITERGRIFFDANGFDVTGAHAMGSAATPVSKSCRWNGCTHSLARGWSRVRTRSSSVAPESGPWAPSRRWKRTSACRWSARTQATFWDALRLAGVRIG